MIEAAPESGPGEESHKTLSSSRMTSIALLVWALGSLAALVPLVLGRTSLWLLRRRAKPVSCLQWRSLLAQASSELGLRRPVREVGFRLAGTVILIIDTSVLSALMAWPGVPGANPPGGFVGNFISHYMTSLLAPVGSAIVLVLRRSIWE